MAKHTELTFGGTPFLLESHAHIDIIGEPIFVASAFRIEQDGHALRAIADHNGEPLELPSESEDGALERMGRYLEARFGARGHVPGWPKGEGVRSRHVIQPPLSDERAVTLRASVGLRKGQHVVIAGSVAKPIPLHMIGINPDARLGRVLEDIAEGSEGRVWEFPRAH